MFLSAVSVLVVAQSSSEIPEGLMNNPVFSLRTKSMKLILLVIPITRKTKKENLISYAPT